jgi:hypothetical protein
MSSTDDPRPGAIRHRPAMHTHTVSNRRATD